MALSTTLILIGIFIIMEAFFSPEDPILKAGQTDALIQHFDQILYWLQQPVAAKEQILASHVPLTLTLTGVWRVGN